MENIKVDVIIPAYHPGKEFSTLIERLTKQTFPIHRIIVMNTEETYWNKELEEKLSALVKVYEENKPKHGRVLRHHMLAYPKLRSTKYTKSFEETMEEIKKHLEKLRKEK